MNRTPFILFAASALGAAAATASAQHQVEPPQNSLILAERVANMKVSLSQAIATAEKHTNGVAIALRMCSSRDQFQAPGMRPMDKPSSKPMDRSTRKPQDQEADRSTSQTEALYAIVTCVIDEARVREVVVDLKDKSVIGVYSVAALRDAWEHASDRNDYANASYSSLVRATDLMNAAVKNGEGDTIGDLDNLAIDPDTDRVIYGVLSRGGFFGLGESHYAIASSELSTPRNGFIVLNLDESDFSGQSGFDNKKWPTQANRDLATSWDSEFADPPATKQVVKASDVIGTTVQCRDGKLGKVDDLIVEPRTGRVVYAVVKSDHGMLPIPMAVLEHSGDSFIAPMTLKEIQLMPTIDSDREPNWSDAMWNRRIHESYGVQIASTTESTRKLNSR